MRLLTQIDTLSLGRNVRTFVILVFASATPGAQAQDNSDPRAEARSHHEQGLKALQQRDNAVAEGHFRAALRIYPRASTALNLALVLQEEGQCTEAISIYRDLLDRKWNDPPSSDHELKKYIELCKAELAQLRLTLAGADRATLFIDGKERQALSANETLRLGVDPGEHRVQARSGAAQTPMRHVVLNRGQSLALELVFPTAGKAPYEPSQRERALQKALQPEPHPTAEQDDSAVWWWVGGGAALAAVAAVVVVVLVSGETNSSTPPAEQQPLPTSPFPTVQALRATP